MAMAIPLWISNNKQMKKQSDCMWEEGPHHPPSLADEGSHSSQQI